MPNRFRQKGDRAERAIVELLRSHCIDAYRTPLSGAISGFKSDVEIRIGDARLHLESKSRAAGFSRIYKWLEGNDGVVIKADRQEPLVVFRLDLLARLIAARLSADLENVTDKISQSQPLDNPSLNIEPVTNSINPNIVLIHDDKVYLSPTRTSTLRIASEDDLRKRDEELMADRNKYLK